MGDILYVAILCSCVVNQYSVFCIISGAASSLLLMLSYSGQCSGGSGQQPNHCGSSRRTSRGALY